MAILMLLWFLVLRTAEVVLERVGGESLQFNLFSSGTIQYPTSKACVCDGWKGQEIGCRMQLTWLLGKGLVNKVRGFAGDMYVCTVRVQCSFLDPSSVRKENTEQHNSSKELPQPNQVLLYAFNLCNLHELKPRIPSPHTFPPP